MKFLKLEEMTTEQKLGMTFCARPNKPEDYEFVLELVKKRALGSVQVSPKRPDMAKLIRDTADYPILVICDTESGFPGSALPPIPIYTLAACNNEKYYEVFAKGIVTDAKNAGFNATWGPVIDVLHSNGPCRVSRHISDDPMKVAKVAEVIAEVFRRNSYLSCGKHYPGGRTLPYDGHMAPVPTQATEDELREFDLIPYKYLMDKGLLPTIMTSHSTYANIDPDTPGTLSPKVQRIIRDMGFDGVTYTDSFAMMAILQKYGEENVMGIAIAAGNDIVLPNYRTRDREAFAMLEKNYADGMFTEERLNEAARRVLKLHQQVAAPPEKPDVFTEEDRALYDSIARDCITAVCDEGISPALDPDKDHMFVILTDNTFTPAGEDEMEINGTNWFLPHALADKVRAEFPDSEILFLPEFPNYQQNEKVLVEAAKHDDVVFLTYCTTWCYLGTDGLTERVRNLIDCVNLCGKLGGVVHFGNPYALQPLLHVPRKIFGYQIPATQPYTVEVLSGKLPAPGKLPFNIEFQ